MLGGGDTVTNARASGGLALQFGLLRHLAPETFTNLKIISSLEAYKLNKLTNFYIYIAYTVHVGTSQR